MVNGSGIITGGNCKLFMKVISDQEGVERSVSHPKVRKLKNEARINA